MSNRRGPASCKASRSHSPPVPASLERAGAGASAPATPASPPPRSLLVLHDALEPLVATLGPIAACSLRACSRGAKHAVDLALRTAQHRAAAACAAATAACDGAAHAVSHGPHGAALVELAGSGRWMECLALLDPRSAAFSPQGGVRSALPQAVAAAADAGHVHALEALLLRGCAAPDNGSTSPASVSSPLGALAPAAAPYHAGPQQQPGSGPDDAAVRAVCAAGLDAAVRRDDVCVAELVLSWLWRRGPRPGPPRQQRHGRTTFEHDSQHLYHALAAAVQTATVRVAVRAVAAQAVAAGVTVPGHQDGVDQGRAQPGTSWWKITIGFKGSVGDNEMFQRLLFARGVSDTDRCLTLGYALHGRNGRAAREVWRALLAAGVAPPGARRHSSNNDMREQGSKGSVSGEDAVAEGCSEGSALGSAVALGDVTMARALMEHGARPTDGDLRACREQGHSKLHRLLLQASGGRSRPDSTEGRVGKCADPGRDCAGRLRAARPGGGSVRVCTEQGQRAPHRARQLLRAAGKPQQQGPARRPAWR